MKKESQYYNLIDLILPKDFMKVENRPTDEEANALFELWKSSPKDCKSFSPSESEKKHINSWKIKGLVSGSGDGLILTESGRKLIVDMVTNEPNAFEVKKSSKKYSEIIQSKKEKGNRIRKKAFNLHEMRIRKNGNKDKE